ncbi:transcription termination/antitermination protein NusG [Fructilactobacillus fructivorans]|uniref:Transcription termination/antitermination protein NusG n=1 Tax=Fructilactobacillus fructivorans TaxID=1614 RepID=A0A0C1M679_9LACO|nr:transcription termination/antitermination protein NusG [Fructilactobacillus fructivorans]KID41714.1 Transcription antitermination protein NusG [Fructilactobacillus fructivorans]MCT0151366.1 transcription termination/antitermination protein NusG [Fructilactobacillus fructivorans]MCT2867557.1 transcription termination/antitermination protein NusG [Fructilactobacillus fructivorans]MCT2868925.1 transcription termination/antitermination protein NusG [Fructilactobacillus fructivorans]MCT2873905.1
MVETAEKQWYVLHTYSGYENKVKMNLESRKESMGMEDYIFDIVVPETEEHEVKNGKEKVVMNKTFPGYVLVQMVMTDRAWYVVRNTPGVTGFIGSHGQGSKPNPLLPEEVDNVMSTIGVKKHVKPLDSQVGDTVTIVEGAFKGLSGKITEIDNTKGKLKVNIDMFGRETSTELEFDQVKPLEADSQ